MPSLAPRFTLACLTQLALTPPKLPATLWDMDHPLLAAATLLWSADEHHAERISSIDDVVLLKCKPNVPWRAAVWEDEGTQGLPWLVAAGKREDGSRDDLYAQLERQCVAERKRRNRQGVDLEAGKKTYARHLLPVEDDRLRLHVDLAQRALDDARASITSLVSEARRAPNQVVSASAFGADVEAVVQRNEYDELYVLIHVVGSAPSQVHELILSLAVPDAIADDWGVVELPPHRDAHPGEIAWYTLLEVPKLH